LKVDTSTNDASGSERNDARTTVAD